MIEPQPVRDDRIERGAVVDRVIDLDDLLIHFHRVRQHDLAAEQ